MHNSIICIWLNSLFFLAPHSSSLWSMPSWKTAAFLNCISARWPHHVPSSPSPAPNKLLPNINFDEIKLDFFVFFEGHNTWSPGYSTCVRVDFLHRSKFWYLARNCLVHGSFRTVLKWVQLFWFIYFFYFPFSRRLARLFLSSCLCRVHKCCARSV